MPPKTKCPVTRRQFKDQAKPVTVTIGGNSYEVQAREFSTGSLGWYLSGKTTIDVGGTPVAVQIGLNLTVLGSKEVPREEGASPAAAASPEVG